MGPKECVHHWWSTEQPGHCHEWLAVASGARHPICHVSLPENCRAVVAKAPVFESVRLGGMGWGVPNAPAELGAASEAPYPGFHELLHQLSGDHLFDGEADDHLR